MKQQSLSNNKSKRLNKPFSKRKIYFPSETFIELVLSSKDVKKMRQWMKDDDLVVPYWYHTCKRVLFINETKFEEWKKR
jgi:hypothetical protein